MRQVRPGCISEGTCFRFCKGSLKIAQCRLVEFLELEELLAVMVCIDRKIVGKATSGRVEALDLVHSLDKRSTRVQLRGRWGRSHDASRWADKLKEDRARYMQHVYACMSPEPEVSTHT